MWFLYLYIYCNISASDGIKLTEKLIPSHAIKGEDVVLECLYDLQGDSLYSVKWYRNGQEFYRHIPTDKPSTVVFRKPGLIVDVSSENHFKTGSLANGHCQLIINALTSYMKKLILHV